MKNIMKLAWLSWLAGGWKRRNKCIIVAGSYGINGEKSMCNCQWNGINKSAGGWLKWRIWRRLQKWLSAGLKRNQACIIRESSEAISEILINGSLAINMKYLESWKYWPAIMSLIINGWHHQNNAENRRRETKYLLANQPKWRNISKIKSEAAEIINRAVSLVTQRKYQRKSWRRNAVMKAQREINMAMRKRMLKCLENVIVNHRMAGEMKYLMAASISWKYDKSAQKCG